MRRWILAALLPLSPTVVLGGTPLPDAPHIVVTGEAEVSVAPDTAVVTMEVQHRAASPAEAKRVADLAVNALLDAAPAFGVAPDHMRASDLNLREEIEYDENDKPVRRIHEARREVQVRLDDLAKIGPYMDAALAAGMTGIDDVTFETKLEDTVRRKARELAVAEATEKAAGLATAFGGALGPVYSINSVNSSLAQGYGSTDLDRIMVSGSRIVDPRYLQPTLDFTERVSAVFEITRGETP